MFRDIYDSLLNTKSSDRADTYFILKDFRSYAEAHERVGSSLQRREELGKEGDLEYRLQRQVLF